MRKQTYITIALLFVTLKIAAMLPGNSQILTCPFCGTEKEVLTLLSGNTIGAEYWSDNKEVAPMMPVVSYIQKCPKCGKYYIIDRQEIKYDTDSCSMELGTLTFPQMKEAYDQISKEGFQTADEEKTVRFILFQSYNDYFYRSKEEHTPSAEDKAFFAEQGKWIIANIIKDESMKAEFYRQIGEMAKAEAILDSLPQQEGFLKDIVDRIRERIAKNDTAVFKLNVK